MKKIISALARIKTHFEKKSFAAAHWSNVGHAQGGQFWLPRQFPENNFQGKHNNRYHAKYARDIDIFITNSKGKKSKENSTPEFSNS